jgi:hypothetical protein
MARDTAKDRRAEAAREREERRQERHAVAEDRDARRAVKKLERAGYDVVATRRRGR